MVTVSKTDSREGWAATNFWKLRLGPNREFRVERPDERFVLILLILAIAACLAIVWCAPQMSFALRVAMSCIGVATVTGIATFLTWMNNYQRRLGPYLFFDGKVIILRHEQRIDLTDFGSFEIIRLRGLTADGFQEFSQLVLHSKSGKQIEILRSVYHRRVTKLRQQLDSLMTSRQ